MYRVLPERKKVWIALAAAGALAVALVAGSLMVWTKRIHDRWSEFGTRLEQLTAEARLRNEPRPALRDPIQRGNAWQEYSLAIDGVGAIPRSHTYDVLNAYAEGGPKADRAAAERVVTDHIQAIAHLQRGVRYDNGAFPYKWEKQGTGALTPNLQQTRVVALVAAVQARLWADAGRGQQAVDLLLDLLIFGNDVGRNGSMLAHVFGRDIHDLAADQLRYLLAQRKVQDEDLPRLSQALTVVDRDFPRLAPALANEALVTGWTILNLYETPSRVPKPLRLQTALLYARGMHGFEELWRYAEEFKDIDAMTFPEVMSRGALAEARVESSSNPIVSLTSDPLVGPSAASRETVARIRMLRMASDFIATGAVTPLRDPCGTSLSFRLEGNTLTVWSYGRDGKDDEGQGQWDSRAGEDLVLKVTR